MRVNTGPHCEPSCLCGPSGHDESLMMRCEQVCAEGYYVESGTCNACAEAGGSVTMTAMLVVLAFLAMIVAVLVLRRYGYCTLDKARPGPAC
jgi:hypothetical protein